MKQNMVLVVVKMFKIIMDENKLKLQNTKYKKMCFLKKKSDGQDLGDLLFKKLNTNNDKKKTIKQT